MAALSNYLENRLLDHTLRVAAYPQPAGLWVALFTDVASSAEMESGTLTNEVAAGGFAYARKPVTFDAAVSGATQNSNQLVWQNMPAVTIAYAAIMDASTSGNVLFHGPFAMQKTMNAGDTFFVVIGDLDVSLD